MILDENLIKDSLDYVPAWMDLILEVPLGYYRKAAFHAKRLLQIRTPKIHYDDDASVYLSF